MANGVRHRQQCEAECERNAKQADADLRESGRDHRTAAAAKGQPECTDRLSREFSKIHVALLRN